MSSNLFSQVSRYGQNQWAEMVSERLSRLKEQNFVPRIWGKDPALWKKEAEHQKIIKNCLGWLTVADAMLGKTAELGFFAEEVKREGFKDVVLLGMGGSSLASEVFRAFLPVRKGFPKLHMLDSTDPAWVASVEKSVNLKKTLFVVSSKSGTTVEPLCFLNYFYERTGRNGAQFVAVTDPGSFLESQAKEENFKRVFINPPDIGGRFSALSYFGLVPAALSGVDVRLLLERAKEMMRECSPAAAIEANPGVQLGVILGEFARLGRDKVTLLLPGKLQPFALWIEQLLAESSGKEGKGIVPIAGEPILSPEDYGEDRLFLYVYDKTKPDRALDRKAAALEKAKQPLFRIALDDAMDLGGELFRWEFATAAACAILGVNTFDQPGVQASKDMTKALLKELKEKGSLPDFPVHLEKRGFRATFSQAAYDPSQPQKASFENFLSQVRRGDYVGLLAYLPGARKTEQSLLSLRRLLLKKTGAPTLFGYGPRYLHSTGQLHKGGPNTGLYFILAAPPKKDLKVPGQNYSFGQLELAQALGDFQALDAKNRRAVHILLDQPAPRSIKALEKALAEKKR